MLIASVPALVVYSFGIFFLGCGFVMFKVDRLEGGGKLTTETVEVLGVALAVTLIGLVLILARL